MDHGSTQLAGRRALLLLCLSQLLVVLDLSVVSVALPSIEADLGFGAGAVSWTMSAYALAFGGALLLGGRAADLVGARRALVAGLLLFGAASLVGGLAWSPAVLIAARAAQGLGAAAMSPATLSLITSAFPRSPQREQALGVFATMASLGLVCGLLVGGAATEVSWRWVMWLAVPVCAVALLGAPRMLPAGRRRPGARLDASAAVLVTASAGLIVFGLSQAPQHGWTSPMTGGALAGGLLLAAGFLLVERRSRHPLVPRRLFGRREVAVVNAALLVKSAFGPAWLFVLTLYFQRVCGLTPMVTGLAFVPLGGAAFAAGLLAPRLLARAGDLRRGAILGQLLLAAGILASTPGWPGGLVAVLVGTAVGAVGYVLSDVAMTVIATSAAPDDLRGAAAGLLNTSVQVGAALGLGLTGAIVSSASDTGAGGDLVAGLRAANMTGACFAAAAAAVLALLPANAARQVERNGLVASDPGRASFPLLFMRRRDRRESMTAITPRADATIGVAVMAAVTIGAIAPGWSAIEPCAIAAAIVAGAALRAHRSLHLALSLAALRLAIAGLPFTWPFNLALGLIAYAGLAFAIGPLRPGLDWLRRGRLDLRERRLIVAFVLVACAALCGWVVLFDPDLSQLAAQLPDWPLPLLALAGLIFALVNAAAEEALFRGIMYRSIEATTGSAGAAVLLQAVCFGAMHMHGFPNGWVGVGLAVIFGVMTGALRALSGGLLAPFIAHVFADLTIFTLLAVAAA